MGSGWDWVSFHPNVSGTQDSVFHCLERADWWLWLSKTGKVMKQGEAAQRQRV